MGYFLPERSDGRAPTRPLDVPCLGHDVAAAGRGLRVTLEGNDAAGDGYGEPVRMGGESFKITFFVISWRISSSSRL